MRSGPVQGRGCMRMICMLVLWSKPGFVHRGVEDERVESCSGGFCVGGVVWCVDVVLVLFLHFLLLHWSFVAPFGSGKVLNPWSRQAVSPERGFRPLGSVFTYGRERPRAGVRPFRLCGWL